ncbi:hypothetical protein H5410_003300 [Solanum commersonii]|uniref:Uncharacterized protein n=1 Tax=Solanum commersonii TaxID=4109 RepID=A0A9J6B595_SOLCO|nr:hypothetical protein H5410_003300 [Solanum commersonii]
MVITKHSVDLGRASTHSNRVSAHNRARRPQSSMYLEELSQGLIGGLVLPLRLASEHLILAGSTFPLVAIHVRDVEQECLETYIDGVLCHSGWVFVSVALGNGCYGCGEIGYYVIDCRNTLVQFDLRIVHVSFTCS